MTDLRSPRDRDRTAGLLSAVAGLVALAAFVWAWLLSTVLDPPNWVRVPGLLLLPVGLGVAIGAGLAGRRGAGRPWALAGLALVLVTVAGLVALAVAYE